MSMPLALAALLMVGATAEEVERARTLFEVGRQAYAQGRYLVAARAFQAADTLAPRPAIVFSVGQSYRLQLAVDGRVAHLEPAIRAYRSYLERAPEGRRRADAAEHLAALEERRAELGAVVQPSTGVARGRTELMVSASVPEATISVDGGPERPLPFASEVAPGAHQIEVRAPGHAPFESEILAVKGRVTPVLARPEPLAASLTVEGPSGAELYLDGKLVGRLPLSSPVSVPAGEPLLLLRRRGHEPKMRTVSLSNGERRNVALEMVETDQRRVARGFFVAGGVGAALTGAAVVGAVVSQAEAREIYDGREQVPLQQPEVDRYNELRNARGQLWATAGVLAGLSGVLLTTGAVLFLTDDPPVSSGLSARLTVSEAGLGLTARF